MTALAFITVAFAGGIGAAMRLGLDAWIRARTLGLYPWGTTVINVSGSFAVGFFVSASGVWGVPTFWQVTVGLGLFGGFTTFSTMSVETVGLIREGRVWFALATSMGVLVGAVALAAFGFWLGQLF